MKRISCSAFLITLLTLSNLILSAQENSLYSYQDLSSLSYKHQRDSIKKNWACPSLYKEKATQAKFKEIWDSRTDFLISSFESNDFIKESDIYNYVDQIITEIVKANPKQLSQKPLLILDRSATVNAYSLGNNVLLVNMGIVTFSKNREELALAIAHELAHDILNHVEKAMEERAVLLTSDEYKQSLDAVLDSKYERLTRLKKIIVGYSFSRNRHNRYHESDADSLGIILLKNSHISFNPEFFLHLDSSDNQYKNELLHPVKDYFLSYNLPVEDWWFTKRTKGLSSHAYSFKDSTYNADSLKTHPDCIERYENTKDKSTANGKETEVPNDIKERANKIMIWDLYNNLNLTSCLYRILLEKDKGNTDPWYDFMTYNVLAGLYYSNTKLNRFNAIGIKPKEYISKSYSDLQTMLEQIPADKLFQLCNLMTNQPFWASLPKDARDMKKLMTALTTDSPDIDKIATTAAKEFLQNNPTSMYCELADHFKK